MKIITDTREISPLTFTVGGAISEVITKKLDVGDYRALYEDGTMGGTVFERKSIGDLFGTMTSGYERFRKEMSRAEALGVRLILIVECTFSEVMAGYERSMFEGRSMIKKLGTLWFKYGLATVFSNGRDEMAAYIASYFIAEGYQRLRERGDGQKTCKGDKGHGTRTRNSKVGETQKTEAQETEVPLIKP